MIAGGGVRWTEAVLALSTLAPMASWRSSSRPTDEFVYRPMLVAEPFGAADVLRIELERVARDTGARHTKDALVSVDPGARTISTASGNTLGYDALLIALGANPVEAVPALSRSAARRSAAASLSCSPRSAGGEQNGSRSWFRERRAGR